MHEVTLVVEGDTDIPFARKLLAAAGLGVRMVIDHAGKSNLDPQLPGYNAAAQYAGWFVLRDLDQDAACASVLRNQLLPTPARCMCFRIPVRALEAWVLGDAERLVTFLKVKRSSIPLLPEQESDPKRKLVDIAGTSSSKRVRQAFVPRPGAGRKAGPGYEASLIEFGHQHWRWREAEKRCPSLKSCLTALKRLSAELEP